MQYLAWPSAATALFRELSSSPGRIALIADGSEAYACAARLGEALGVGVTSLGKLLTSFEAPPTPADVPRVIGDETLLTDIDILFWPELAVDPFGLLRNLSRSKPRFAVWPGRIEGRRAMYSQPGRRDWFEASLSNTNILTPRKVHFPDEVPYILERIPA